MAQNEQAYDVIIIGGGPGGYVAAIRAAQLGLKAAVAENKHLGGICLNWGCIPTKALLRSAEIFDHMNHAKDYGLSAKDVSFDLSAVVKRSRGVSAQLNGGVGMLLRKNKVDVLWGTATIEAPGKVKVEEGKDAPKGAKVGGTYAAKNIIIATGARPRVLPGLEPDKERIWTYFEAMVPKELPKSLLVVGSGAIGIEFASFFNSMGSKVTVVEVMDQILPVEDVEIAKIARKQLEKKGLEIITGAKVAGIEKGKTLKATIEAGGKKEVREFDRVISAVGVVGNIDGLGLEKVGVKTDRGIIVADGMGRTSVKGIFAIGDVAGPPMLAHKAEHEGVICVEGIAGKHPHEMDKGKIPGCTYCQPQVASVGLTEAKAKEAGRKVKVGRFPFIGNGKAIALGEPDGMVKTVFDATTGELLGAHMVGAEVTELIQGFVVAMNLETTEEDLMHAVFPHPTLSEMMHESVLDAYGRAIHI
ncbi:dihydrolipoyl dehydrogenase [Acuticoccus sp. MNP-M23]|uniref:dihydrolipoyl dehydrogenase n=1 Tax=Acuticoccus sp. MNP-M23 TaxID=3072793 RepID=UPI0028163D9B|nr:dihydrolipoyl dehydrogenase [Acuticoccus sp. MNP-M23]WMS41071.1 dihydrolipoyl dehydrogenase [Acuticoccus sp. MNP-M23]